MASISKSYPTLNRSTHGTLPFTLSPMVPMVHLRRQEQGICNGRREVPRRPAEDPAMVGLFRCGAMTLRFDFAGLSTNETIRADVGLSRYWVLHPMVISFQMSYPPGLLRTFQILLLRRVEFPRKECQSVTRPQNGGGQHWGTLW